MSLIDNNLPLDGEVVQILEELLASYLENIPPGETFLLSKLYADLEIKDTKRRSGTLDGLIDQTLHNWNWYRCRRGLNNELMSFSRRTSKGQPHIIQLLNGTRVETGDTWPPYDYVGNRGRGEADSVREKIIRSRQRRRADRGRA